MPPDLMTTAEVADYLRLKERKVYELVGTRRIPFSRVSGKLLFPRRLIDLWVSRHVDFVGGAINSPPAVAAGSHDPLLEWALKESRCDLAMLFDGSEDGLRRLADGRATLAGLHLVDSEGGYNVAAVKRFEGLADVVLIGWAWRDQGLVTTRGNPLGLEGIRDLARDDVRVAFRQPGSGSHALLHRLLEREGLGPGDVGEATSPALGETDLATAILDGKADCGLAVRAVARRFGLDFIPLHRERFELAVRRRDYFEPPVQKLLAFARTAAFAEKAETLGGYDITDLGTVVYNP